ncbi:putative leucine-rich repeat receptor-like protein kinase At2g19210 [Salvia miltiorrhiza]|uniref:putative leucine-rich repeat receptor-like protein kinase At2g19210 n=1 Tax=Salvia miltiorrhiza TaxID=226208 RepID=UPI0025AC2A02|nr:putative leucine-rich repeat receptor-like protein kinase At2g19210 [Salvia miltiorrhiza]
MGFPSYKINVYINLYFSELTQLGAGQNRSFRIFKDNKSNSDPIIPPYGDCVVMYVSDITVSSNTTFSLVPTNVSTLPPLINALEIFRIADDKLTNGTNKKDVEGLSSLQERFSVLQSWSGDPCLPAPYTWDWIKCNLQPIPRVTTLILNGYGLSGLLPDFKSMDALQTINLNNNSLRGPIPDFLGTLPNLKILNLANNQFNGTVPASLSTKKGLILMVSGNPDLCTTCHEPAIVPTEVNSSIKKKNILELLFIAMIASVIIL